MDFSRAQNFPGSDQTGHRARRYVQLALAVVLLQAAYWLSYGWISQYAPIPIDNQIRVWNVGQIEEPTLAASGRVTLERREVPIDLSPTQAPAYHAFTAELVLDALPAEDIGIGLAFGGDNVHLFVNGFTVSDPGRLAYPASYHAQERKIIRVSRGLLREGANQITAISALNEARDMSVYVAIVGDYHALMDATAKRRFFLTEYKIVTVIIAGVVALVLSVLVFQTQNRAILIWLTIFCTAIAARAAIPMYYGSFGGEAMRFVIILGLACLVPFSLFMFVHHWTGSRFIWLWRAAIAACGAALSFILIAISIDAAGGLASSTTATNALMTFCSGGAIALLAWHIVRAREIRVWELSSLLLVSVLCLVDSLSFLIHDRDSGHLRLVAPVVLVGLVAAILSRNLRLFESMGAFNDALNAELHMREQIIERNYHALAQAEKQRNLVEERSRILRDVHDGIGGQLTGLLVQARAGRLEGAATERGLETAMNDLRLVIESLDPEFDCFAHAIDTMRARFARQLDAAGIALDWNVEDAFLLEFSPSATLQIARIFQESIANAIRHSGADLFMVRGARRLDEQMYVFQISDNGKGCSPGSSSDGGRGLENMRSRAAVLKGEIDAGPRPGGGFEIELRIPMPT